MARRKPQRDITVGLRGFMEDKGVGVLPILRVALCIAGDIDIKSADEEDLARLLCANISFEQEKYKRDPRGYKEALCGWAPSDERKAQGTGPRPVLRVIKGGKD